MIDIDRSTEFGERVARRLKEETIIWLTTVGSDGTPQPRPVWFYWNGEEFIIYSQPQAHKVDHIRRNPRVSLNFDSDGRGGDIIVFTGTARIAEDMPSADEHHAMIEKYREGLKRIGSTPEGFAQSYSTPIRVEPDRLRGH